MIPNEKELSRIMDKCVDLVNDREVNYLIDTILYLQGQVKLFKDLYHNVSNEADKQIEQLKEEAKQWSIVAHVNREEIEKLKKDLEVAKNAEVKYKTILDNIKDYCLGDKALENTRI